MVAPVEGPAAAGRGVLEFCNPDIKSALIDIKENYSQLAETIQVQSLEHTHNVHVTKTEHRTHTPVNVTPDSALTGYPFLPQTVWLNMSLLTSQRDVPACFLFLLT
jgi:hypothetical protein